MMKINKKKLSYILLIILSVVLLFSFTACSSEKDYRVSYQGSCAREIPYEEINGLQTISFDNYKNFEKSNIAEMTDIFGDKYNVVFYNKFYFDEKNLIVTKFNARKGDKFLIENIEVEGNEINVDLIRFRKTLNNETATYGLFLECPKNILSDNVNINIKEDDGVSVPYAVYESIPPDTAKADAFRVSDKEDLLSKVDPGNNIIIKKYLDRYNDDFFTNSDLIVLHLIDNTNTIFSFKIVDDKLLIDTYSSDHYIADDEKDCDTLKIMFVQIPKDKSLTVYNINEHWEADFNSNKAAIALNGVIRESL